MWFTACRPPFSAIDSAIFRFPSLHLAVWAANVGLTCSNIISTFPRTHLTQYLWSRSLSMPLHFSKSTSNDTASWSPEVSLVFLNELWPTNMTILILDIRLSVLESSKETESAVYKLASTLRKPFRQLDSRWACGGLCLPLRQDSVVLSDQWRIQTRK